MDLGGNGRLLPEIALVDIGQFHALAGSGLHRLGKAADLGAVIRADWREMQRP